MNFQQQRQVLIELIGPKRTDILGWVDCYKILNSTMEFLLKLDDIKFSKFLESFLK